MDTPIRCPDGSACITGSLICYGPVAGLCGRPEYAAILARETARREAARMAGLAIAPHPLDIDRRGGSGEVPPAYRPEYAAIPYRSRDEFLAPVRIGRHGGPISWHARPWEGTAPRKPWQYRITAGIAHIDQPELLELVIATLRAQTLRPFIHVVDTGSNEANRARLRALELSCDDVQVDQLNPRGWRMTSFPVAVAMDLIFSSAQPGTEYIYSTHVDVFLKSPRYLEFLAARCDAMTPVVGYQMSDRSAWGTDLWRIIPSHTASLYHLPTMRKIGASWSMTEVVERLGMTSWDVASFPDTEVNLGLDLREAGIGMRWLAQDGGDPARPGPGDPPSWLCLGPEPNAPYETPWLAHQRSHTAHMLYLPDDCGDGVAALSRRVAECRARLATWAAASTCIHRTRRGHCGEWSWTCALGRGQAGIIEPEGDCIGCEQAEAAVT